MHHGSAAGRCNLIWAYRLVLSMAAGEDAYEQTLAEMTDSDACPGCILMCVVDMLAPDIDPDDIKALQRELLGLLDTADQES